MDELVLLRGLGMGNWCPLILANLHESFLVEGAWLWRFLEQWKGAERG